MRMFRDHNKDQEMNIKTNKYGYIEQPGCHMCKHVFIKREYDDPPQYYCTYEKPPRPKCGSVLMEEEFDYDTDEYEQWEEWDTIDKHVEPWGICKKFEED